MVIEVQKKSVGYGNLLKAFVGKLLFSKIWSYFSQCSLVLKPQFFLTGKTESSFPVMHQVGNTGIFVNC